MTVQNAREAWNNVHLEQQASVAHVKRARQAHKSRTTVIHAKIVHLGFTIQVS
jgi:hypothetical protein